MRNYVRGNYNKDNAGNLVDDNRIFRTVIADFTDSRTDCQHLPDRDVHSGTDAYVRAENPGSICRNADIRKLDSGEYCFADEYAVV